MYPAPFAVYHKNDSQNVDCTSFCVVSECHRYDTSVIRTFILRVLEQIKTEILDLENVVYFRSFKSVQKLSQFRLSRERFQSCCQLEFFATSHWKSPCDRVGGTIIVARASLHTTVKNRKSTDSSFTN